MLIPDRIGRYRIIRLKGTGAASSVFEAHDPLLDVTVAVKVLADHLIRREDMVSAFLREARLLRSIEDPRVVAVHDIGVLDTGQPFMVMDLLDQSLADRLVGAAGDVDSAVRVARELGAALQAVHSRGLVHLDVKPANVFVQRCDDEDSIFPEGASLVLGDFGLASQAGEAAAGLGTRGYMSPEQGRGESVDARADVYAMAAVVRRVACGVDDDPHPMPKKLEMAVQRARADDPGDRPNSVAEFLSLIDGASDGGSRTRRRRVAAAAIAAFVLVAMVGILFAVLPADAPAEAVLAPDPPLFGPNGISSFGSTIAVADTENHRVVLFDGDGLSYVDGLRSPTDVAFEPSGRLLVADTGNHRIVAVEQGAVVAVAGGSGSGFGGDGGPAEQAMLDSPRGIDVAPDGSLLIADTGNRRVRAVDPRTGQISTIAGTGLAADSGDGSAAVGAGFLQPVDVAAWRGGVAVADNQANRVRWIDPGGVIEPLAGNGSPTSGGDGGLAVEAAIAAPSALVAGTDGSLLVVDSSGAIRSIEPSGVISTVAQEVDGVRGVTQDADGVLFVTLGNSGDVVELSGPADRRVVLEGDPSGPIGDGATAQLASLLSPSAAAVTAEGALLIADSGHSAIRSIEPTDTTISTVARVVGLGLIADLDIWNGRAVVALPDAHQVAVVDLAIGVRSPLAGSGRSGDRGDGALAPEALLRRPVAVAVGAAGEIYVVDAESHRVRVVDSSGVISAFVGTGQPGSALATDDPLASELLGPTDVAVGPDGTVWVADAGNDRVLKVSGGSVEVYLADVEGIVSLAADSSALYVATSGEVLRVDQAGPPITVIDTGRPVSLANSPDGLLVVDPCAGTVSLLGAAASTEQLRPLAGRVIRSCS